MFATRHASIVILFLVFATNARPQQAAMGSAPLRTEVVAVEGTVEDLDYVARQMTLRASDGSKAVITVAPAVANLVDIKKGDHVVVKQIAPLAVSATEPGQPAGTSANTVAVQAPADGSASVNVGVEEITSTVETIDPASRTVVLRGTDGMRRTVKIAPSVDISEVAVGDQATLRLTRATAVAIERPAVR